MNTLHSGHFLRHLRPGIVAAASVVSCLCAQPQDKPNVILILADDMAYADMGMLNGGTTNTPRLDQLARESIFFNRGYSAAPVCAPARAAMLTGRYPHRTGVTDLNKNTGRTRLHLDETTIADLFARDGYATALIGKWHCGDGPDYHPLKRGFQEFSGYTEDHYGKLKSYSDYALEIGGKLQAFKGSQYYMTNHFTALAMEYVRRHRDKPFFLQLAYNAPHRPLGAPQSLIDIYKARGFDEQTATVYAMVEVMDTDIGKLLDELDTLGIAKNTIVIFASDNGPDPYAGDRPNAHLKGKKYTVYDGGIHVPFMIRWPATLKPGRTDVPFHFIDLLPTLAAACAVDTTGTKPLDGVNMMAVLRGEAPAPERALYWQWNRGLPHYTHNAALLEGQWKLVRPFVSAKTIKEESSATPVLFDMNADPAESTDLSAANAKRHEAMNAKLSAWAQSVEKDRTRTVSTPTTATAP